MLAAIMKPANQTAIRAMMPKRSTRFGRSLARSAKLVTSRRASPASRNVTKSTSVPMIS